MRWWRRRTGASSAKRALRRRRTRLWLPAALVVAFIATGPRAAGAYASGPVNNVAPEVVGNPAVGERIVCAAGSWSGSVTEFRYKWVRSGIPIASGVYYIITTADKGHELWCVVTAVGPGGSTEAESSNSLQIGTPTSTPPEPETPPKLSGEAAVGKTLSCSTGTWKANPPPTYAYQWLREEGTAKVPIEGATTSTYEVTSKDAGHTLFCRVTATNAAGSASALSEGARVAGHKPVVIVPPKVFGVEPAGVGESLTCWPGTWTEEPAPSFSYQWLRDGAVIPFATGSSYTIAAADELHTMSCRVTATNSEGSAEAASSNGIAVRGAKPENTAAPHIAGTPAVGVPLSCEQGSWTGVPTPTYTYVWVRDPGTEAEAAVASTKTYTPVAEDVGHALDCKVTASNSAGSATAASERVVVPGGGTAPKNEAPPAVSGVPVLGETLTCSEGTWSGSPAPSLFYQWLRDGMSIPLATASTYAIAEADLGHSLSCRVEAVNNAGSASKSSNVVEISGTAPKNVEPPLVTGTPEVGELLSCALGSWTGRPAPAFTYQWLRDEASIPGATARTYRVGAEDRGRAIACLVTAHNVAGSAEAPSNVVEIGGQAPVNIELPEVLGTPAVNETLRCTTGVWSAAPAPVFHYQWLLGGAEIPSATTNTYTVENADRGLAIACRVTATNREGSASANSKGVRVPGSAPKDVEAPTISGTPATGQPLTCVRGVWEGQPPPVFTYQWLRDGAAIAGAHSVTYQVEAGDQGHSLSCRVTATNTEGKAEAESKPVSVRVLGKVEVKGETTALPPGSQPTSAQILAALTFQLSRAEHRARIASLRRSGQATFPFNSPAAGRLALYWYATPPSGPHAANTKPTVLAISSTTFSNAGTKTVKLVLTSAGRSLIAHASSIALTFKGVFIPQHGRHVVWAKSFLLNH